jgi:tRNA (guanine-N7-)-methyltransferase
MKLGRLIPKKADYRMRAHINPLSSTTFPFPPHHTFVDWRSHYPAKFGCSA